MADLSVNLGPLKLENPIILASGYLSETENIIRKADGFGLGAIVIKSSLIEEDYSKLIKPFTPGRYPQSRGRYSHGVDGLLIGEAMSDLPIEWWADWLARNKDRVKTPLIPSVAAVSLDGYVKGAKMFEEAGAAGVEILLGCPAPYFLHFEYSMTANPRIIREICQAVKKELRIPMGVKTFPVPSSAPKAAYEAGADWVTLGGGILGMPGVDLETMEPFQPYAHNLSGSAAAKFQTFHALYGLRNISMKAHISPSGGLQTWQDVAEAFMYGAGSTQMLSVFMKKGFRALARIKNGLADYLDSKGFANLQGMKGLVLSKVVPPEKASIYLSETFARTKGLIVAIVDEPKCNGCMLCEEICARDAIRVTNGVAVVNKDLCVGCGLCVLDCPTYAISLGNLDLLKVAAAGIVSGSKAP